MLARLRRFAAFLRSSHRKRGFWKTARVGVSRVYRVVHPYQPPPHPFDMQHGLDTAGLLKPVKIAAGHAHDRHATGYYGTHPSLFGPILLQWQRTLAGGPHRVEDYTFLDAGCGKGRALMLASSLPFRRIVGIELSPALAATARANLAKWQATPHACNDIQVLEADVLEAELPATPVLLYAFHPFDQELLERWLCRLAEATRTRTAPLDFAYVAPIHDESLRRLPEASLLWAGRIPYSPEDAAADAFRSRSQSCTLYRLQGTR